MKQRVDQLLVSRSLVESRTRAQALIMAGVVFSGERKVAKAGELLANDAPLEVRGKDHPWVSGGGIKVEHGLTRLPPAARQLRRHIAGIAGSGAGIGVGIGVGSGHGGILPAANLTDS